jgi:outer membrane protein assembly factor BamB
MYRPSGHLAARRLSALLGVLIASAAILVACGGHAAGAASSATAGTASTSTAATASTSAPASGADWPTFDHGAQRSGVGPASTGITAANLRRLATRVVHIDGTVDSSPIELSGVVVGGRTRDVVVVTTTYGRTIALDPATGIKLWEFVPGDIGAYQGSPQITTATPTADPDRRYVYAASPDGQIHKLVLATGREVRSGHWPVRVTFDARREKLDGALNLIGRWVIATTGGYYGDAPTYEGHVVLIDRTSGHIAGVWNAECSNEHHLLDPPSSCRADTSFGGSAIWGREGVVVEPGSGRLLVSTGNGPFNGSTDWGDSVLELSPTASRLLHNWTPRDQAQLNTHDTDLGSTEPALLAPQHGYHLAVQGGKDGMLHLLNLNLLDGTRGGAGGRTGGELEDISSPGGGEVLTAPVTWSHAGRAYLFVADDAGTAAYTVRVAGRPRLVTLWRNGSAGTSPVLAGGLLYIYDERAGALKVYRPLSGQLIRSLPAASGHWNSPIIVGGRIVLPTGNANAQQSHGEIFIYHLPGD